MEEQKQNPTEAPKTTFIDVGAEQKKAEDIFEELSGGLDFGDIPKEVLSADASDRRLLSAYQWADTVFKVVVVVFLVLMLDLFIRTAEDNGYLSALPICSYLSFGVEGYDNADCKTVPMIVAQLRSDKEKFEKTLVNNLVLFVPKKFEVFGVTNSPEVQFIQERTGANRISLNEVIRRFSDVKNTTPYQGEDVDCSALTLNEKGDIDVKCETYGGPIDDPSGRSATSRTTALALLKNLNDPSSGFHLLDTPKTLQIEKYVSNDIGIKSAFSTKTTLSLKLRYTPLTLKKF